MTLLRRSGARLGLARFGVGRAALVRAVLVLVVTGAFALPAGLALVPGSRAAFTALSATGDNILSGASTLACEAYRAEVLLAGPASFWRLGDVSGSAVDQLGVAPGTYANVTRYVPSHGTSDADRAAQFGATNAEVAMGDVYDFAGNVPFSTAAWLKWDGSSAAAWPRILDKSKLTAPRNGWEFVLSPTGQVALGLWVGGVSVVSATTATVMPVNTWVHVAAVYDGSSVRVYLNGVLDGATAGSATMPGNSQALRIGNTQYGSAPFPGVLDDVAVFAKALTAAQVARLASANCSYAQVVARSNGLVEYWRLDDITGTAAVNEATGGTSGTYAGTGAVKGGLPGLPSGGGYSVALPATASITVGDVRDFASNAPHSIEVWFRVASNAAMPLVAKATAADGWGLWLTASGGIQYRHLVSGSMSSGLTVSGSTANIWHHAVLTYDATSVIVYLDGSPQAMSGMAVLGSLADTTAPLTIGGGGTVQLDDVSMYSRVLTPAEVTAHWNAR